MKKNLTEYSDADYFFSYADDFCKIVKRRNCYKVYVSSDVAFGPSVEYVQKTFGIDCVLLYDAVMECFSLAFVSYELAIKVFRLLTLHYCTSHFSRFVDCLSRLL